MRTIRYLGTNDFIFVPALVSLLTISDLLHEGQKIISVSYRSLEVYLAVALWRMRRAAALSRGVV